MKIIPRNNITGSSKIGLLIKTLLTTICRYIMDNRLLLLLTLSLLVNTILIMRSTNSSSSSTTTTINGMMKVETIKFHGGHPITHEMTGSCVCSSEQIDVYCMCTPSVAIDVILLTRNDNNNNNNNNNSNNDDYSIWLVRRKDTDQLAVLGGFVQVGETVEDAVRREIQEETGIIIPKDNNNNNTNNNKIVLYGVYSDPRRDNRRHTISITYVVYIDDDNGKEQQHPVAADDVKDVVKISIYDIEQHTYFADHMTILLDYRKILLSSSSSSQKKSNTNNNKQFKLQYTDFIESPYDFANDIERSVCIPFQQ